MTFVFCPQREGTGQRGCKDSKGIFTGFETEYRELLAMILWTPQAAVIPLS